MIGNITFLNDGNNYGQRLQLYAIQRFFLLKFGERVTTLDIFRDRNSVNLEDDTMFHRFERECLDLIVPRKDDFDALSECSRIILGGDQMLNNGFIRKLGYLDYITRRTRPLKNVFAYSAGLDGSHSLDEETVRLLGPHMIAYGTREPCVILQHVMVVDPVFLDKEEFIGIGADYCGGRHGHRVTYRRMRPGMPQKELYFETGKFGCQLMSGDDLHVPDPRDFLGLMYGADSIETDMFHGVALGLLFNVPNIKVVGAVDHRISNLLDVLGVDFSGCRVVNYRDVNARMERLRGKSIEFIEKCMA